MKKILFVIILFLLSINNVNAEACDAYDIKRLKEIAEGVEITYELQEPIESDNGYIKDAYKINVIGLTEELVIINSTDNKVYDINTDFNNEILYGESKSIKIHSTYCSPVLRNIVLKLPVYNVRYDTEVCKKEKNKNLDVCQEWVEELATEYEFYQIVNGEKEEKIENFTDFFKKNKNIIIVCSIMVVIIIVVVIRKKKKEVLT